MTAPWWRARSVKYLSPLNSLAVAAAQLNPPEDWQTVLSYRLSPHRRAQLYWLCWHARPDLRQQQMNDYWFNQTYTQLPPTAKSSSFTLHPDTIAEWSEPPQWSEEQCRQQEWDIRAHILQTYDLSLQQCQSIHPEIWNPTSLGFQAAQSEEHGTVLLEQIQRLNDVSLAVCIGEYAHKGRALTDSCGAYLQNRAKTLVWSYRLACMLTFNLKPFPEELLTCLLNSSDPKVRKMGVELCQQQKKRR